MDPWSETCTNTDFTTDANGVRTGQSCIQINGNNEWGNECTQGDGTYNKDYRLTDPTDWSEQTEYCHGKQDFFNQPSILKISLLWLA